MIIRGLQKLTLLDYPGKTACTVFTGGCNMRCVYCHNSDLVLAASEYPPIPEDELFTLLEKRKGTLDGVCITGGEPMLQKDLPELCEKIKAMGYLVKIDTNGTFPRELRYILSEGLCDYVAMDIKNSPAKYGATIGRENFDMKPIYESIEALNKSGIDHEFRTTTAKNLHTYEDLAEILGIIGKDSKYFIQAYRDSEKVMDREAVTAYTPNELREIVEKLRVLNPNVGLRGI